MSDATHDVCPTCYGRLSYIAVYKGEHIPPGTISHNVIPLHIAEIRVDCENGHKFTAQQHDTMMVAGEFQERYRGLRPRAQGEDEG